MELITQNFEMYEGNSRKINVTCVEENGTATNLTGATIKWALKKSVYEPTNIVLKDTANDVIVIGNPTAGKFMVKINPVDTEGQVGALYHEAEVIDAEGNHTTVMIGTITIHKSGI